MEMECDLRVYWSDRVEALAERLFASRGRSDDPFARTCVVVGDPASRDYLQSFFMAGKAADGRGVLANVDFIPIAEFVNDWLAAQCGRTRGMRRASEHPYARDVMAWRIFALLERNAGDPAFSELTSYVDADDGSRARRRFALSCRIAALFDDYLASRHQMLCRWEHGIGGNEAPGWQFLLYRMLVEQSGETYAADYADALSEKADLSLAFENGFRRYEAVHVFDVAAAPLPYLQMLVQISRVVPVRFWSFNPSREYWLDNHTKRSAARELAQRMKACLAGGAEPPDASPDAMFDTADDRLLGALATGARGVLSAELDFPINEPEWIGGDDGQEADFSALRGLSAPAETHVCHSPRRELEAIRDAIHHFLRENPDARPHDVRVLCADWNAYAPLVESVFGEGGDSAIPVSVDGGLESDTPIVHSFSELLALRDGRFTVNAVLSLLGVPAVRDRFEIDAEGLDVLRDMVVRANVHWGLDDEDAREAIGGDGRSDAALPFTWRRAMDRLALDALLGPREDEDATVSVPGIGRILPCGHVEDDRAALLYRLWRFVRTLKGIRRFLREERSISEWRERLLRVVDEIYADGEEAMRETAALRKAVDSAMSSAARAEAICGDGGEWRLSGDVVCKAVLDAVVVPQRRGWTRCDSVKFAPLKNASAVPARFVWICGLNDGAFPRKEYRPSFDVIGRHPTLFDVSPRERDAFALLKAALGARDRLAFSYVGRDVRSGAEIPPSVPFADLRDWLEDDGRESGKGGMAEFVHPLQSYSGRYFTAVDGADGNAAAGGGKAAALPPSYSSADYEVAAALSAGGRKDAAEDGVAAFECAGSGPTQVDLDDLAAFFANPSHFLWTRRLYARMDNPEYDVLGDDEPFNVKISGAEKKRLLFADEPSEDELGEMSVRIVEKGRGPNAEEVADAILKCASDEAAGKYRRLKIAFPKKEQLLQDEYGVPGDTAPSLCAQCEAAPSEGVAAETSLDGNAVEIGGKMRFVDAATMSGIRSYAFAFSMGDEIYDGVKIATWVRHVVGHASGKSFVSVMMCNKQAPLRLYLPLDAEEARRRLDALLRIAFARHVPQMPSSRSHDDSELFKSIMEEVGCAERIVKTAAMRS